MFSTKPNKEILLTKIDSLNFEFKIFPIGKLSNIDEFFLLKKEISIQESTLGTKKYFENGVKFIEKSFGSEKQFSILFKKITSNLYQIEEIRFHFSLWEIYYDSLKKKKIKSTKEK